MRLQAAVSLLHLSTVEVYANAIAPKFLRLALTVQVSFYLCVLMFRSMFCFSRIHATISDTYF